MAVGLNHYLVLSALLFSIGLFGVLARRNAVAVLMAIELMLNAANLAFVAFSRYITPILVTGQVFALFVMTVAAAEAAVALGIILALYRYGQNIDVERIDLLKG